VAGLKNKVCQTR